MLLASTGDGRILVIELGVKMQLRKTFLLPNCKLVRSPVMWGQQVFVTTTKGEAKTIHPYQKLSSSKVHTLQASYCGYH